MTTMQEAIQAVKSGDVEKGRRLLLQVIEADPENEQAWLWLAKVVDSDKRRHCLDRVLAINPQNEVAKRELKKLKAEERTAAELEPQPSHKPDNEQMTRHCPYCAETIRAEAVVCRYCNRELEGQPADAHKQARAGNDAKDVAKSCLGVSFGIISAPIILAGFVLLATFICCGSLWAFGTMGSIPAAFTNSEDPSPQSTSTRRVPATFTPGSRDSGPSGQFVEFSGTGNLFERVTLPADGTYYFASGHFDSPGYFNARFKDDYGNTVALIANCANACEDKRYIDLEAGTYFLEVSATEAWTIIMATPR